VDKDQIEAFKTLQSNMTYVPFKFFKNIFANQMKTVIKKRIKNKETPESIYVYFTEEPIFINILSYCQISLDDFKSWIK
jgi:hypothetical protein